MKPAPQNPVPNRNPFWACLLVFAALGLNAGMQLDELLAQRGNMARAHASQDQEIVKNMDALKQQPQVEARLQALTVDLIQVAHTNSRAAQIVQEFGVSWAPPAQTNSAAGK